MRGLHEALVIDDEDVQEVWSGANDSDLRTGGHEEIADLPPAMPAIRWVKGCGEDTTDDDFLNPIPSGKQMIRNYQ